VKLVIKCPWGCGFEGPPDEYVKHLETCPKKTKVSMEWTPRGLEQLEEAKREEAKRTKDWRFVYVSREVMDKLARFQVDIDGEIFCKLFMQVGGSRTMADHLWYKFRDVYNQQVLPLWLSLDLANRELVLAVINRWTGK